MAPGMLYGRSRSPDGSRGPYACKRRGLYGFFIGQTSPGTEGEAAETELVKYTLLPQMMSDRMFLLSVEEALKYRKELWDTVSEESPYSRGYLAPGLLFIRREKTEDSSMEQRHMRWI